jgi:hypothetical protein
VQLCAYGVLVPALPWPMIGLVWAYVLVWMVVRRREARLFPHRGPACDPAEHNPPDTCQSLIRGTGRPPPTGCVSALADAPPLRPMESL